MLKIKSTSILLLFSLAVLIGCSDVYKPSVFEKGIFKRNVDQVASNNRQILKNNKQMQINLEHSKEVKERAAAVIENDHK